MDEELLPNGEEISLPPPRKADLLREHIKVIEEIGPSMLIEGMILISGEIARTTGFEGPDSSWRTLVTLP